MTNITLYHYWRSSCSWRVRWALALKQVPYTSVTVNLLQKEHHDPKFLAKSPLGQVPCLETPDLCLTESLAILEWLEESFPTRPLLPQDAPSRGQVRELAAMIASGTQPLQNLHVLNYRSSDHGEKARWAQHFISRGLKGFEEKIQNTAGTFSFGATPTMADLCLIPQVYNALRFKVDMNQFPNCERIYHNALKTQECDAAAPHNQPGSQP